MTESEGDRAARRVLDSLTGAVAAAVVAELDRTTTWRPANNGPMMGCVTKKETAPTGVSTTSRGLRPPNQEVRP